MNKTTGLGSFFNVWIVISVMVLKHHMQGFTPYATNTYRLKLMEQYVIYLLFWEERLKMAKKTYKWK